MSATRSSPTPLETWLETRLREAPAELEDAIRVLLDDVLEMGEEEFVTVAVDALEAVARGGGTRESAMDLLAADAILTYAFEAAADPARGGSAARALRLARRVGPLGLMGRRFDAPPEAR